MELLRVQVDEEHHFLVEHQKRVAFYTSMITAILGATIAGSINAGEPVDHLLLLAGPVLVGVIAGIARDGTSRLYQRFLEAITARAKVEQALGLTRPFEGLPTDAYWPNEPFVVPRHANARQASASASEFVTEHRRLGYEASTRRLLFCFQGVALGIAALLVARWALGV